MLISVIIPTKNRATSFLPELLASIKTQELPYDWQLEVVIYDDGSSNGQKKALDQIAEVSSLEITVIHAAESIGPAAGRNAATLASRGNLVVDIDDDDILPPGSLNTRIRFMERTGAKWSFGNAKVIAENGALLSGKELVQNWNHGSMSKLELMEALLNNKAWFWAGTRTYRRNALFDESNRLRAWDTHYIVAQDLDHWVRLVDELGPPLFIDDYLILWREKQNSHAINAQRSGLQAEMINHIRASWQPRLEELGQAQ